MPFIPTYTVGFKLSTTGLFRWRALIFYKTDRVHWIILYSGCNMTINKTRSQSTFVSKFIIKERRRRRNYYWELLKNVLEHDSHSSLCRARQLGKKEYHLPTEVEWRHINYLFEFNFDWKVNWRPSPTWIRLHIKPLFAVMRVGSDH